MSNAGLLTSAQTAENTFAIININITDPRLLKNIILRAGGPGRATETAGIVVGIAASPSSP